VLSGALIIAPSKRGVQKNRHNILILLGNQLIASDATLSRRIALAGGCRSPLVLLPKRAKKPRLARPIGYPIEKIPLFSMMLS
jgi:hypothetical protein